MTVLFALAVFASLGVVCHAVCGNRKFGGCDKSRGLCWDANDPKPATMFCTCKAGYTFLYPKSRKGKCIDINECKTGAHACDTVHGRCVNTIGSHYCTCKKGYVLDFTKTKCLRKSQITGLCKRGHRRKRYRYDFEDEQVLSLEEERDVKNVLLNYFLKQNSDGERKLKCGCDTGYSKCRNVCKDINECKLKKHICDLKRGHCHNSIGGYFCSCKKGYLLGPCGYKCYKPKLRPTKCSATSNTASSLVRGDSNGLNDEASLALVLDVETEKQAKLGKINSVFKTKQGGACTGKGSTTEKFDLNQDGKTDVIVHYTCINKVWVVKSTFDKQAYWTQWTCWTECKATCHGGIQTRTRYCKNGLVGEGICKGAATQSKTCYKGKRCPLRVRRNANTLTSAQKCDLLQAFKKYKEDTSTNGFWAAAGTHIFPRQCLAATGGPGACCYHGARLNFVAWHRAELLNFEEGLTRYLKDKTLGLPYWNWLVDDLAPGLLWDKKINGHANPFASMVIRHDLNPPAKITRAKVPRKDLVVVSRSSYLDTARKLMEAHSIHEFSEALENAHNTIHMAVCPDMPGCKYSMGSLAYAGFDPAFFFHHTNVDRLFSNFQQYMHKKGETAWTRQSVLEPQESIYHFNEPYKPFHNKTLTSFKRLNTLSTIQDLFHYKELLGYTYDTLSVSTAKKGDSEDEKEHIPTITNAVNVMQYERSLGMNVRISFFIDGKFEGRPALPACKAVSEDDARFVGAVLVLGSEIEKPWVARSPVLKPLADWISKNASRNAATNFNLRACFSRHVNCIKNCAQVSTRVSNKLPSPQLMFYPKNIRNDLLKFEWNKDIRMPAWTINIKGTLQWLHFWGKESGNVYQVPSSFNYKACSLAGAKKIDCTGSCILTSGYHYFVHGNKARCKAGLRLKVLAAL